ncbi:protein-tyrosine phosphatase-like protein, partial [Protomyces lactucae-debilis]
LKWDYTDRRIFQEIQPGVFLGPLASSRACETLAEHRITTLVAIRTEQTRKIFKERYPEQFRYEYIDIVEGSLLSVLPRITPFIQGCLGRGERLLFYDETGNAKGAVVVCAYLMETLGIDSATAYSMVKNKRLSVTLSEHERYQLQ